MGNFRTLLIVFVVLKLVDLIDWSWWWVLSPLSVLLLIGFIQALMEVNNE